MDTLADNLEEKGVLRSNALIRALCEVDRVDFVPKKMELYAYADEALPIGFGQTISQPYTVVFMLEHLAVKEGDTVLEVGYGSGWQTALISHLVGEKGRVFAFEIVPELCKFGRENIFRYPYLASRVSFFCGDASPGVPDIFEQRGGFDRIIAAADVRTVPQAWREQLKEGGVLVYPSGGSIFAEKKGAEEDFEKTEYPGFVFVPFVQ